MKSFVYSVFDSCAAVYDRPFICGADGQAIRSFGDIAENSEHPIGQHPEHYSLWRIGSYCDKTAHVEPCTVVCIARAHELMARPETAKLGNGGNFVSAGDSLEDDDHAS